MSQRDSICASEEKLVVAGYPQYYVSSDGLVWKKKGAAFAKMASHVGNHGYLAVGLRCNGKRKLLLVHRLVAAAFVGPCPTGTEVNHKDGNRLNNSAGNLEYISRSENIRHAQRVNGSYAPGHRRGQWRRLKPDVIAFVRATPRTGGAIPALAAKFGVSHETIRRIYDRRTYSSVS